MSASHEQPYRPPAYRTLMLQPDVSVLDTLQLIAADDNEALAMARAMTDGHAVELWDGLRFIEHFDPDDMGT